MAKKLFDHLHAVTAEQDPNYFDKLTEEDVRGWSNFMINRFLSMKVEWVQMIADLLPLSQNLAPKEMYKMYIGIIPKGRHYTKYIKGRGEEKYEEFLIDLLKTYYSCSKKEAIEYAEILYATREGREEIKELCEMYARPKKEITKLKLKL
jgi:hypothetical protein